MINNQKIEIDEAKLAEKAKTSHDKTYHPKAYNVREALEYWTEDGTYIYIIHNTQCIRYIRVTLYSKYVMF